VLEKVVEMGLAAPPSTGTVVTVRRVVETLFASYCCRRAALKTYFPLYSFGVRAGAGALRFVDICWGYFGAPQNLFKQFFQNLLSKLLFFENNYLKNTNKHSFVTLNLTAP